MRTLFKTLHFLGLALFLGSIVSYIVVGAIAEDQATLNFSRTFVFTGTQWLTIPAMWLVGLTGICMSGIPRNLWQKAKAVGFLLIVLNTHVFILPAISDSISLLTDTDQALFEQAMLVEAIAGFINIVFILLLIIIAIKKRRSLVSRQA